MLLSDNDDDDDDDDEDSEDVVIERITLRNNVWKVIPCVYQFDIPFF